MARPQADYAATFDKLVKGMGLDKPVDLAGPEIAQLIDEPAGRVVRMLDVMKKAGTLDFELRHGQGARYILRDDNFASTETKMRAKGLRWSQWQERNVPLPSAPQPPHNGVVVKSLAELRPLLKSEPRAEIEVARKYRDQQAFIDQQRKTFADMGLELPSIPETVTGDRKVELTAIIRVLPYIDTLEHTNENLEQQNKTIRAPMGELTSLRSQNASQKEQIERLIAEKGEIKDSVRRMMDDHRKEVLDLKGQLDELDGQLRHIKGEKSLNGAVMRHEINEALTKIG